MFSEPGRMLSELGRMFSESFVGEDIRKAFVGEVDEDVRVTIFSPIPLIGKVKRG
jgi:hypothetical protein